MDVNRVVLEVVAKVSGSAVDTIEPGMDLVGDLGIDSPKALQLLVDLEERLEVEISDEDAATLDTVADVLACAERLSSSPS